MTQQTFDFERADPNDICRSRHNSNRESNDAFKSVNVSEGQQKVIAAFKILGDSTSKEIAEYLNVALNAISPRFSELRHDLKILIPTGERREKSAVLHLKGENDG
jgi:protein subunit release factor A